MDIKTLLRGARIAHEHTTVSMFGGNLPARSYSGNSFQGFDSVRNALIEERESRQLQQAAQQTHQVRSLASLNLCITEIFGYASISHTDLQELYKDFIKIDPVDCQVDFEAFARVFQEFLGRKTLTEKISSKRLYKLYAEESHPLDYRFFLLGLVLVNEAMTYDQRVDFIFDMYGNENKQIGKEDLKDILSLIYVDMDNESDYHTFLNEHVNEPVDRVTFNKQFGETILHDLAEWKVRIHETRDYFLKKTSPDFYEKSKSIIVNLVQFYHPEESIEHLEQDFALFEKMKPVNGVLSKYGFKKHFEARGKKSFREFSSLCYEKLRFKNSDLLYHIFESLNPSKNDFLDAQTFLTTLCILRKPNENQDRQHLLFDFVDLFWTGNLQLQAITTFIEFVGQKSKQDAEAEAQMLFEKLSSRADDSSINFQKWREIIQQDPSFLNHLPNLVEFFKLAEKSPQEPTQHSGLRVSGFLNQSSPVNRGQLRNL